MKYKIKSFLSILIVLLSITVLLIIGWIIVSLNSAPEGNEMHTTAQNELVEDRLYTIGQLDEDPHKPLETRFGWITSDTAYLVTEDALELYDPKSRQVTNTDLLLKEKSIISVNSPQEAFICEWSNKDRHDESDYGTNINIVRVDLESLLNNGATQPQVKSIGWTRTVQIKPLLQPLSCDAKSIRLQEYLPVYEYAQYLYDLETGTLAKSDEDNTGNDCTLTASQTDPRGSAQPEKTVISCNGASPITISAPGVEFISAKLDPTNTKYLILDTNLRVWYYH